MGGKCATLLGPRGVGSEAEGLGKVSTAFMDAPFVLPCRTKGDEVRMRTWRDESLASVNKAKSSTAAAASSDASSSSSLLPPFVPPAYAASVAAVLFHLLEEEGGADVLFAFSEGCIVACYAAMVLESIHNGGKSEGSAAASESIFSAVAPLRAVVLAAPPLLPAGPTPHPAVSCPLLVYIGSRDAVVRPDDSRRLIQQITCTGGGGPQHLSRFAAAEAAGAAAGGVFKLPSAAVASNVASAAHHRVVASNVTVFEHGGAHMVPYSAEAVVATRSFFSKLSTSAAAPPSPLAAPNGSAPAASSSCGTGSAPSSPQQITAANISPKIAPFQSSVPSAAAASSVPRYSLLDTSGLLSIDEEALQAAKDEADVLASMFGAGGDEGGNGEGSGDGTIAAADWRSLTDAASADEALRALRSVALVGGGAHCLLERTRADMDAALSSPSSDASTAAAAHHKNNNNSTNINNQHKVVGSHAVIAQCLVPLVTRGEVAEACGPNIGPAARKALAEMGEAVVACLSVVRRTDYYALSSGKAGGGGAAREEENSSAATVVVSLVSGVPRAASHHPQLRALVRTELPASARDCPSLLSLAMAAAEGVRSPLTEFYVANCELSGDGDAAAADEVSASTAADNQSRAIAAAWAAVDDESADDREEAIEAARARAMATLLRYDETSSEGNGNGGGWRRRFCGRQSTAGGTWDLVFGLVGKPSAGKSSFFSAAAKAPAKVGSYPFTTIEPNISPAFAPMACPCSELYGHLLAPEGTTASTSLPSSSSSSPPTSAVSAASASSATARRDLFRRLVETSPCGAEHSCVYDATLSTARRVRRQAVLLKDVAGLVKGAYRGAGRGNRFLNDLCEADALIHVVDGAGATNAEGWACPVGEGSSPLADVAWVRNEVHSWVFDNVRAKWDVIRRRPQKFREMFSGYRASGLLIDMLLSASGIGTGAGGLGTSAGLEASLPSWLPADLHAFVALFIFVRFPMVLAVNKVDLAAEAVAACGAAIAAANPMDLVVCLSAKEELALNEAALRGLGVAEEGAAPSGAAAVLGGSTAAYAAFIAKQAEATAAAEAEVAAAIGAATPQTRASKKGGVTYGLQSALRAAVEACLPIAVYPIADLSPLLAGPLLPAAAGGAGGCGAASANPHHQRGMAAAEHVAKEVLPTILASCALVRPGTSVEAAKASFLNIPNNRKLVRIEAVRVAAPTCGAPLSANAGVAAASVTGGYPRRPALMHPQDEFSAPCFLHVMTNARSA